MSLDLRKLKRMIALLGVSLSFVSSAAVATTQTAPLVPGTGYIGAGTTSYGYADGCDRKMYVYRKPGAAASGYYKPIMLLYGGGWSSAPLDGEAPFPIDSLDQDPALQTHTLTQQLVNQGFVVFLPYYRLTTYGNISCRNGVSVQANAENIEQDVKDAFLWVYNNRASYSAGNYSEVSVIGGSAGGHLALSLAFSATTRPLMHKVLAIFPPSNFTELKALQDNNQLSAASSAIFDSYVLSAPSYLSQTRINRNTFANQLTSTLRNELPHILLFHGYQDTIVPVSQSIGLCTDLADGDSNIAYEASDDYAILARCGNLNKFYYYHHHYIGHGNEACTQTPEVCAGADVKFRSTITDAVSWLTVY